MDRARVIRSAGAVGAMTLASRTLGFVRDILMAGFFGTSGAMSAFVVAFKIPNLFRALFGEGALSAAFIPVFVETRQREGEASAWRLARRVFTASGAALALLVAIGMLGATLARQWPGLHERTTLILSLLQIMLPYTFFICLAAVAMAALNSFGRFALPAAVPCLLNVVWIGAIFFVCPRMGATPEARIHGVAWAVLVAGLLQWIVQVPPMMRLGFRPWPLGPGRDARLMRMIALMGPVALGRAVTQVNVALDALLAAAIGQWAAAALYYSERMIYLPMGIFATALGTVLLPLFSGHAARGDEEAIRRAVNHALRMLMFVMIPAAVGLWALSVPIVRMCFEWRTFDARSTLLTARALRFYAAGMIVFSLGKVFVPAFYALQDTRTPVRVGVWTVGLNIVLSIAFMLAWPLEFKHAGIAFATVVAETVNGLWLAARLHRRLGSPGWRGIARSVARTGACALAMGAAAVALEAALGWRLAAAGLGAKPAQIGAAAVAIGGAVAVYVALSWALRSPEWADLLSALRRRTPSAAS